VRKSEESTQSFKFLLTGEVPIGPCRSELPQLVDTKLAEVTQPIRFGECLHLSEKQTELIECWFSQSTRFSISDEFVARVFYSWRSCFLVANFAGQFSRYCWFRSDSDRFLLAFGLAFPYKLLRFRPVPQAERFA